MKISTGLYKIAKKLKRVDSAGIFLPLPKHIAKFFPKKKEDSSPPHVTILYLGGVLKSDKDAYKKVLEVALEKTSKLGKVFLDDLAFFKNQDNQWIAHNPIRCEGLGDLRKRIWKACEILGLEIQDSFPKFKPHATLAYLDQKKYDKEVFVGSFNPTHFEIWGFDQKISVPIK